MSTTNTIVQAPGPGENLVVVGGGMPDLPEYGAIVKIHCAGICHSDIHMSENRFKVTDDMSVTMEQLIPHFTWPYIPGHEIAGEVLSLDAKTKPGDPDLKIGDRVLVYPWLGCRECGMCDNGSSQMCKLSSANNIGVGQPGGYQAYLPVARKCNLVKLPDSIPDDVGCLLPCSGLTAYHACLRLKDSIQRAVTCSGKAKLLIIGAGGLGLWAASISRAVYPGQLSIYMADVSEDNLNRAKERGVDETILWSRTADQASIVAQTKEATGGIDAAIDFVGTGITSDRAIQSANKGATVAMVGLAGGLAHVSLVGLILNNISLAGVLVGSREQLNQLVALYQTGKLKSPPLQHVTPEGAADALNNLKQGKVQGRSIIKFV